MNPAACRCSAPFENHHHLIKVRRPPSPPRLFTCSRDLLYSLAPALSSCSLPATRAAKKLLPASHRTRKTRWWGRVARRTRNCRRRKTAASSCGSSCSLAVSNLSIATHATGRSAHVVVPAADRLDHSRQLGPARHWRSARSCVPAETVLLYLCLRKNEPTGLTLPHFQPAMS